MNKTALCIALSVLCYNRMKAQDLITRQTGEIIQAKVVEVNATDVKYKKFDNLEGPDYSVRKSEVKHVEYQNGTLEKFEASAVTTASAATTSKDATSTEDYYSKGKTDAVTFYKGHTGAGTATLVTTLLIPIAGLIPAIACSTTPPEKANLGYPNSNLFDNNVDYQRGYKESARKKKSSKVWTNFGIGALISIAATLAISK